MTWLFLLHLKSEVSTVIYDFLLLIKSQFNASVKVFRSDNDTEFFNEHCRDIFKAAGIIHQSSCVHTP